MITLIENGEIYAPAPRGRQSVLVLDGTIARIGAVDRGAIETLAGTAGVECQVIDASGCVVSPGLIDPHEHILGGSGEQGFASMTPEIFVEEIVSAGVTTVVGCLGTDVTMKNMPGLVGKAKALREEGLDAYVWTGGYRVPPATLGRSVRDDILYINEVIGVGEIAISDIRSMDPDPLELSKVVHESYVGGMLASKCGLTHFHVGEEDRRLTPLRDLVERFTVKPGWLYATHVERNEPLMCEALALARAGAHVDIDVVEEDLPKWLRFYLDRGGAPDRLTISSDASVASPRTLYEQLRTAVLQHGFPLELVLSLATSNTAQVLGLEQQGRLEAGRRADLLVLDRASLDVVHVRARGGWMVRDGRVVTSSRWLDGNKRTLGLPTEITAGQRRRREDART
jgi:beta-aspartyl-dipeptidase (metallo-type)